MLVNLKLKINYTKLYYQLGNKNKHFLNFYEFGSLIDFLVVQ